MAAWGLLAKVIPMILSMMGGSKEEEKSKEEPEIDNMNNTFQQRSQMPIPQPGSGRSLPGEAIQRMFQSRGGGY